LWKQDLSGDDRQKLPASARYSAKTSNEAKRIVGVASNGQYRGHGRVCEYPTRHDLFDQGALEIIFEDFDAPRIPVQVVYPPSSMPLAETRLSVDLLAQVTA
jgi:hypothetical protein